MTTTTTTNGPAAPRAVIHFRTRPFGGFRWTRGISRRGHWRVLVLADPTGSTSLSSRNVLEVLFRGSDGLDGVTSRSRYDISGDLDRAISIADAFNNAA